jgi:hypothetical protein
MEMEFSGLDMCGDAGRAPLLLAGHQHWLLLAAIVVLQGGGRGRGGTVANAVGAKVAAARCLSSLFLEEKWENVLVMGPKMMPSAVETMMLLLVHEFCHRFQAAVRHRKQHLFLVLNYFTLIHFILI